MNFEQNKRQCKTYKYLVEHIRIFTPLPYPLHHLFVSVHVIVNCVGVVMCGDTFSYLYALSYVRKRVKIHYRINTKPSRVMGGEGLERIKHNTG